MPKTRADSIENLAVEELDQVSPKRKVGRPKKKANIV